MSNRTPFTTRHLICHEIRLLEADFPQAVIHRHMLTSDEIRKGGILPPFIFLLCVAAASFWFAAQGLQTGETRLPARFSGNHRVFRAEKPALFWTSIGLLGTVGTASTGAGLWLVLHRIRSIRR